MKQKKLKLGVAESCTGGALSNAITDIPGASQFFVLGVIAYSQEAKKEVLGVNPETIEKHGVVSPEVAGEMAQNVKKLAKADVGISTTGFASPGEGVPEDKVGLVYIGICARNLTVVGKKFSGERVEIKNAVVNYAIKKLLIIIKKEF
ncbi:MAG: CinA family protein [Thermoplasmata archaeon]